MTRPPSPLKALLWDVDGTLAETERDGHRVAFNLASEAFKRPWRWSVAQYGPLLAITGGCERLLHDLQTRPDAPQDPEARHTLALCPLGLAGGQALALEDAPACVAAACAAGVPVVVTRSASFADSAAGGALVDVPAAVPPGVLAAVPATGPGPGQRDGWRPPLSAAADWWGAGSIGLDDLLAWHARGGAVAG